MKLHIDDEFAARILAKLIKEDSQYLLQEYHELLELGLDIQDYQKQDLATNLQVLKAIQILYDYYTGKSLDIEL